MSFNSLTLPLIINQLLAFLLPVIGLALPGIFKKDGLPAIANGFISLLAVLVVSGIQAYAAGKFGLNPYLDFLAVVGSISGLLAGPLKPLDQFIQSNIGVTSSAPSASMTTPSMPNATLQPIVLPPVGQQLPQTSYSTTPMQDTLQHGG